MAHGHEKVVCSCGALIRQCRCTGSKSTTMIQNGCRDCERREKRRKEAEMFKHANTVFPGDIVSEIAEDGTKVAGHETGKVVAADPSSGKVRVAWPGGVESWHDPERLKKD